MSAIIPYDIDLLRLPSFPLEWKTALPKCQAIYLVLSKQKEVLYVGRSKNLRSRWKSHDRYQHLKQLPDLTIAWVEVSDNFLFVTIERALIEFFKPRFNDPKYTTLKPIRCPRRVGIVNLRKRLGLTQRDVAKATNVTEQTISNWEVGLYQIHLSPEQYLKLCNILQCSLEELIAATEDTSQKQEQ